MCVCVGGREGCSWRAKSGADPKSTRSSFGEKHAFYTKEGGRVGFLLFAPLIALPACLALPCFACLSPLPLPCLGGDRCHGGQKPTFDHPRSYQKGKSSYLFRRIYPVGKNDPRKFPLERDGCRDYCYGRGGRRERPFDRYRRREGDGKRAVKKVLSHSLFPFRKFCHRSSSSINAHPFRPRRRRRRHRWSSSRKFGEIGVCAAAAMGFPSFLHSTKSSKSLLL